MLHSFSNGNTNCQSNVRLEHPLSVGRSSSQTDPPTQGPPTPSSTSVRREIRYPSVASAPQTPMLRPHRLSQPPTPRTSRVVPQPVHRVMDGNSLTLPVMQEAPRSTPHRQGQLVLSDSQNNPPRPPKSTPKNNPKTGSSSNNFIDLCSFEDEGPVNDYHRTRSSSSRTRAQGLGNGEYRTGEESDSDYWSTCLSDDDREEPVHAPDQVSKVQPTHIQKGWIPPVSNFTATFHECPINTYNLDFHRTSSS